MNAATRLPSRAWLRIVAIKPSKAVGHEPPGSAHWLSRMFRCEECLLVVGPGVRAHRVVVETRLKSYPYRAEANRVVRVSDHGKPKVCYVHDPGGVGREIVREKTVCPSCGQRLSR